MGAVQSLGAVPCVCQWRSAGRLRLVAVADRGESKEKRGGDVHFDAPISYVCGVYVLWWWQDRRL
jgi:hypothetical protein